jgi:hypothetical protein
LEEVAQARIQECASRAVADFKTSVRPIYGLLDDRRLTHIGSCLLLEIDGKRVVSTAAHIADDLALDAIVCRRPRRHASSAACGEISSNHTSRGRSAVGSPRLRVL